MIQRYTVLILILCWACSQPKNNVETSTAIEDINEPMPGFNIEGSDPIAIFVADKVMAAMGGRKAWDKTQYLKWTHFDNRTLTWDKHNGDVRIDFLDNEDVYLVNINDLTGKIYKDGQVMTESDSLAKYLSIAKDIWINDSYWLIMPYKLKDNGVTLYYLGEDTTSDGRDVQKLQLVFENTSETLGNVYDIWVDAGTNLVSQWAFYPDGSYTEPTYTTTWADYQKQGEILLSNTRGDKQLSNIEVLSTVPTNTFNTLQID
ncbi:hypothetical protein N6H18_09385 [Reichenbachiella agarivorans]|uniref:Uncharacterized protein n=1 Tax=Reichenbachiella agarivorans TaxID=2979464 RepID=A0ABY6CJ46_9BACT|nr:hypothetical protein [Reichenbachiella agarivorans]UXP30566.1 hypothetical protein N6H18_09385 [Reichenbachiella agarivorans]